MSTIKPQIAPRLGAMFTDESDHKFQLTGYYKRVNAGYNRLVNDLFMGQAPKELMDEVMVARCSRNEAEYVAGHGKRGIITLIENIMVLSPSEKEVWHKFYSDEVDYEYHLSNEHFTRPITLSRY